MHKITANSIHNGQQFVNNVVLVLAENGKILDLISSQEAGEDLRKIEGVLCPGFVNAHCHLELSHMKGLVPKNTGLAGFIDRMMSQRFDQSAAEIQAKINAADKQMQRNGIVAVGDISNDATSLITKLHSKIYYHTFIELYGFQPNMLGDILLKGEQLSQVFGSLPHSFSPHAPYSTSLELIHKISNRCYVNDYTLSIHNQESAAEDEMFLKGTGGLIAVLNKFGVDTSAWKHSEKKSLPTWLPHAGKCARLLLIHNTQTGEKDIDFALAHNPRIFWGLCPNANRYIEHKLPNVLLLASKTDQICLGTDSLASNDELSIVNEINTLLEAFPSIGLEKLLRWATFNGAKALGIEEKFGVLKPGYKPGFNVLHKNNGPWEVTPLNL